ncbi:MAG: hypothetical protein KC561_20480 [Myxococcales bacterium]|nr:hypothetical protein [Myxococcales bacterium]
MYHVTSGQEQFDRNKRQEAIALAKEMSSENPRKIIVTDEAGSETLTFIEGTLSIYSYDTRTR